MFRKLDDSISVAPQIGVSDVAEAARQGFKAIVNNRPDGEAPDEPQGDEIEAAARAAGLSYWAIPVTHSGFSTGQIDAMTDAMTEEGPVLAYCRSGTRSTFLWALARARAGDDSASLAAKANAAGYGLSPIAALIEGVAPQ
ncbi:MAG: TIGR01244 family phosphatase [Sphingomonadaceae bacterium]|nr:TIGR01244 family phosphatase [Sphingomonadaceae bacterium]